MDEREGGRGSAEGKTFGATQIISRNSNQRNARPKQATPFAFPLPPFVSSPQVVAGERILELVELRLGQNFQYLLREF
jgi:hypothetical protein